MKIISINQLESSNEIIDFIKEGLKEFEFEYNSCYDSDLKNLKKFYTLPKANLLLLKDNKKIIGTIAVVYKKNTAVLQRFYISKQYRDKGLGRLLYKEMEKAIIDRACKKIILNTTIRNKEAVMFFNKEGFKLVRKKGIDLFFEKEF